MTNHNSFYSMMMDGMAGAPKVKLPAPPERAITPRENRRLVMENRMPRWIPLAGDYNMLIPDVVLERPAHNKGGTDWFGVEWIYADSIKAPCPKSGFALFDDLADWESYVRFPDLESIDWEANAREILPTLDPDKMNAVMLFNGPFERLHSLMGFENALIGMFTEPEAAQRFFEAMADFKICLIDKLITHYAIEVVVCHDDWGASRAPFFSVEMFEEMLYAPTKRICDYVHSRGCYYTQHCCGMVEPFVPYMVEMGVDAWESAQMNINDLPAIKAQFGDKLVMETMLVDPAIHDPSAGEAAVRAAVRRCLLPIAKDGGVVVTRLAGAPENLYWIHDEFHKLSAELYG